MSIAGRAAVSGMPQKCRNLFPPETDGAFRLANPAALPSTTDNEPEIFLV